MNNSFIYTQIRNMLPLNGGVVFQILVWVQCFQSIFILMNYLIRTTSLIELVLQLGSAELFMQESQFLIYGNGKDKPPTGFMFEKQQMKGLYFNQSPSKVL